MKCDLCGNPKGRAVERGPIKRVLCVLCAIYEDLDLIIATAAALAHGVHSHPGEFTPRARRLILKAGLPTYQESSEVSAREKVAV